MWWPFRSREDSPPRSPRDTRAVPVPSTPSGAPFRLDVAIVSDVGSVREQNEDRGRCIRPGDPERLDRRGVLVLVADGMGGHEAGDVASMTAADVVAKAYYAAAGTPLEALGRAFAEANTQIHAAAADGTGRPGMGTTCTALAIRGAEAVWAHVGDSRLYRLRGSRIERLTTDHSVVGELVADGVISEEEARHHDQRNVITRALGIAPAVEPSLGGPLMVATGDVFVLMSDGLYDLVPESEIGEVVAADPHDAAHELVDRANARGGYDNVTVAVVRAATASPTATARPTAEAPALS